MIKANPVNSKKRKPAEDIFCGLSLFRAKTVAF
jgi:hypothetical protein